jgi:hypothetical protein
LESGVYAFWQRDILIALASHDCHNRFYIRAATDNFGAFFCGRRIRHCAFIGRCFVSGDSRRKSVASGKSARAAIRARQSIADKAYQYIRLNIKDFSKDSEQYAQNSREHCGKNNSC